mmetsp:Transcript_3815/g.2538  ORF Transcript_3815/g.2538 Transcript_3815/m.2538 type:complete len:109 (-) Transcript_3815:321-647(-)
MFNIFTYGCLEPDTLSSIVHTQKLDLVRRMSAATAEGWARVFAGPGWENTSAATIVKSENSQVEGILLQVTQRELKILDMYESYPSWYGRVKLDLAVYQMQDGNLVET